MENDVDLLNILYLPTFPELNAPSFLLHGGGGGDINIPIYMYMPYSLI